MTQQSKRKVVVIGAGLGGLAKALAAHSMTLSSGLPGSRRLIA